MQAGRELDALVAERRGWPVEWHDGIPWFKGDRLFSLGEDRSDLSKNWSPSTSIAAAWDLVERLANSGWTVYLTRTDKCHVSLRPEHEPPPVSCVIRPEGIADTAPLAICLAFLKATESGRD